MGYNLTNAKIVLMGSICTDASSVMGVWIRRRAIIVHGVKSALGAAIRIFFLTAATRKIVLVV